MFDQYLWKLVLISWLFSVLSIQNIFRYINVYTYHMAQCTLLHYIIFNIIRNVFNVSDDDVILFEHENYINCEKLLKCNILSCTYR